MCFVGRDTQKDEALILVNYGTYCSLTSFRCNKAILSLLKIETINANEITWVDIKNKLIFF